MSLHRSGRTYVLWNVVVNPDVGCASRARSRRGYAGTHPRIAQPVVAANVPRRNARVRRHEPNPPAEWIYSQNAPATLATPRGTAQPSQEAEHGQRTVPPLYR